MAKANFEKGTKVCCKCKIEKSIAEYCVGLSNNDGLQKRCKECDSSTHKVYHQDNLEVRRAVIRQRYHTSQKENQKQYRLAHKAELTVYYREYRQERIKTDLNYKLSRYLRTRLYNAVKGGYRGSSAVRDLGCSLDFFTKYIAQKFTIGMSWDNYGEWHLDHIVPLASFDLSDREQCLLACHYSNMQPLWATDNLVKGPKIFSLQIGG